MDAHQILDALSASFFALLGIWAAVVRRHWFLRFTVVCICLLSALLIPAYEVVIEFGLLVSVIVTGVWFARKKPDWRPQFSLETALLLTVVVAVISAIAAQAPEIGPITWAWMIVNGVSPALLALGCMWFVFGRAHLRTRLIVTAVGFMPFIGFYHFLRSLQPTLRTYVSGGAWYNKWLEQYEWDALSQWVAWNAPIVGLAIAIIVTALLTARASGWFSATEEGDRTEPSKWRILSRVGLVTALLSVVVPLTYIFYRLLTPPEYPTVELPVPNGYDDFLQASQRIKGNPQEVLRNSAGMSDAECRQWLSEWQIVLDKVDRGLDKQCLWPMSPSDHTSEEFWENYQRVFQVQSVLINAARFRTRVQELSEAINQVVMLLEFEVQAGHGNYMMNYMLRWDGLNEVQMLLSSDLKRLSIENCLSLASRLADIQDHLPSAESAIEQVRLFECNFSWHSHLGIILTEWSGQDPLQWERGNLLLWRARYRTLVLQVMLQAYWLENGVVPQQLKDLEMPELEWFLNDPFTNAQLIYKADEKGNYTLRSVGANGKTDPPGANPTDDITVTGPARLKDK